MTVPPPPLLLPANTPQVSMRAFAVLPDRDPAAVVVYMASCPLTLQICAPWDLAQEAWLRAQPANALGGAQQEANVQGCVWDAARATPRPCTSLLYQSAHSRQPERSTPPSSYADDGAIFLSPGHLYWRVYRRWLIYLLLLHAQDRSLGPSK